MSHQGELRRNPCFGGFVVAGHLRRDRRVGLQKFPPRRQPGRQPPGLALALCDSAFEAEIFRVGIQSIERGQHEAADSIGLTWRHKMRFIILPQAIRRILPPLGNQFVYVTKMSSLASVIGLGELTRQANELVVTLYRPLEIYTILVLEYMALILVISWGVRRLEARLGSDESKNRR